MGGLLGVLEEGQRRGLIGAGPLRPHLDHALALAEAVGGEVGPEQPALDLGTGGGLPGLVLALAWPTSSWVLLDGRQRSAGFVTEAISRLGLQGRVTAVLARAEVAGRDPDHRGRYGLVVSRGFGPPAVTAECAAPLLRVGGRLVVSEPPATAGERWAAGSLMELGLVFDRSVALQHGTFALLTQGVSCPPRFPRRTGVPGKRPLFAQPQA